MQVNNTVQKILETAPNCFLPQSERMQELTNGVSAIVIGLCCAGRPYRPCCSRASALFRCRAQTRRRASITDITTRNGFCRSSHTPLHKSLRCYQSREGFAELLRALVAKINVTFWPNAVAVPQQALTAEAKFAWGVEIDGAETAHPCRRITEVGIRFTITIRTLPLPLRLLNSTTCALLKTPRASTLMRASRLIG